ncbi:MAG: hypothetical protein IKG58_00450 [Bacilli bacterium]|nr:hypothetical protein [Bacilli bacterium]MBR3049016.1 hypothetical protein [Bacilli bacterium]
MVEVDKLDIVSKREELLTNIKELIGIFHALAENEDIELDSFVDGSKFNVKVDCNNEEEFLKSSIVYLEIAKSNIGDYLDRSGR